MKKLALIFVGLLFMAITLSSCKKDWKCACTIGGAGIDYTIEESTRADAETACESHIIISGTDVCELE